MLCKTENKQILLVLCSSEINKVCGTENQQFTWSTSTVFFIKESGKMVTTWILSFISCFYTLRSKYSEPWWTVKKDATQTCFSRKLQTKLLPSYSPKQLFEPGRTVNANQGQSCCICFKCNLEKTQPPGLFLLELKPTVIWETSHSLTFGILQWDEKLR